MLSQQVLMEAPSDKFIVDPVYLKLVHRPSEIENKALKLDIIQVGQLVPIEVNEKMVILDGHTRFFILEKLGMSIKYIIKTFENNEEEFKYVIRVNVMRRQLNPFQRIEVMYDMLKHERELRRINSGKSYTDIILSIKDGNNTVAKIAKDLEVGLQYVGRMVKVMTEEYYLSRKDVMIETKRGHVKQYVYSLMPKSEERLYKEKEAKKIGKINITDLIGVNNTTIKRAMYLIEHADITTLDKLRRGVYAITTIHEKFTRLDRNISPKDRNYWRSNDNIKCPHCKNVTKKSEYEKV